MKKKRRRYGGYANGWLGVANMDIKLVLLLIFALPVGLFVMWTRECEWNRYVKSGISVCVIALILCAFILLPSLPEARLEGGVEVLAYRGSDEMLAPLRPSGIPETAQVITYANVTSRLISEPTPTPIPFMVRCNDNGRYYHIGNCRYIYENTPSVTLKQALDAGKTACPDCNPPKELTY